jgi:hypothetical protein
VLLDGAGGYQCWKTRKIALASIAVEMISLPAAPITRIQITSYVMSDGAAAMPIVLHIDAIAGTRMKLKGALFSLGDVPATGAALLNLICIGEAISTDCPHLCQRRALYCFSAESKRCYDAAEQSSLDGAYACTTPRKRSG